MYFIKMKIEQEITILIKRSEQRKNRNKGKMPMKWLKKPARRCFQMEKLLETI